MGSIFISIGSLAGALTVMIGAFGAHKWKPYLKTIDKLEVYQTAVEYQFYHSIAIVLVGLLLLQADSNTSKWLSWSGIAFGIGILFFSGSLYTICATQNNFWGRIAPIGGLAFIVGWIFLAVAYWPKS